MILDVATLLSLAGACAPSVAPETLISIVHTESRFNSLAIGVNSPGVRAPKPATKAQAIAAARSLIGRGYNIDLGLGQINSANLGWLGLPVENAFEPCSNLAAAARVIATNYQAVARLAPSRDHAIATALSMYNTGDRRRGFRNGYVARVYASASTVIPLIRGRLPAPVMSARVQLADATIANPQPSAPAATQAAGWNTAADARQAALMVFGDGAASQKGQHP
ncbi:lytic transglycosylase domain-containing protein [Sphingobium sp. PNB]|uniref:lytic transglycosylase domain-containing protein n=1 Tax=Sphingobium sp. PNB TaxID=863934 RepID=UPI001CA412BF|nr:lytic transglycosylase domain-containing protein [Sphingobium sp. PNB]MCB4861771.1 lytic transglycosylase domain-containing protein [Sphingobium sp. PNB]